jgi:anaphase-promoting complex subunit 6
METFLRSWRQDALSKQQYDSATFVGDKLLALTNSDEDALALAETHFSAGNYTRALAFVTRSGLVDRSPASQYLAAHCHVKLNQHDEALSILGDKNPVHLVTTNDASRRKLQHVGNGLSSKQHGKSRLVGRIDRVDRSEEREHEDATNIKYQAGMCYLRGVCYAKANAFDRAKECYKDAVLIDVRCFEAFDQLVKNSLMTPDEEWQFLEKLNFDSIQPDPGDETTASTPDFLKNLYTTRLSKYSRPEEFQSAIDTLSTHYRLAENADVLLSRAELFYTSSRYDEALAVTTKILDMDAYNFTCLPLHVALLSHLHRTHALFALAHDLADTHPDEPCTWLAVGTYYLSTDRIPEARSYFSKASLLDPHFGAAWIGFAHTFAAEGESDQAIAAYSTAARLFQGTHLPQLFLGMQETALGNLTIAREYLSAAFEICKTDPLLVNELGVVQYMEGQYDQAIRSFDYALNLAEQHGAPPAHSAATHLNMAHALRQAHRYEDSLEFLDTVIRLGLRDAAVFAARGLVLLELDQPFEAVATLHEALAISPQDPTASALLTTALRQLEDSGWLAGAEEREVDDSLKEAVALVREARAVRSGPARRPRRRPPRMVLDEGDGWEPSADLDGQSGMEVDLDASEG